MATSYYGYVTTKTDSMDQRLYEHLNGHPHAKVIKRRKKRDEERKRRMAQKAAAAKANTRSFGGSASSSHHNQNTNASLGGVDVDQTESSSQEKEPGTFAKVLSGFLPGGVTINNEDDGASTVLKNDVEKTATQVEIEEEEQEDDVTEAGESKYCWVCQTEVHIDSMHCKYCDKCVSNFDHHCMWLNTCIGAENYANFYNTVRSTFALTLTHTASLGVYVSMYFAGGDDGEVLRRSRRWLGVNAPRVVLGLNLGFLVFLIFIFIMVVQLLTFHNKLRRQKITTYQFIVQNAQEKRDKKELQARVEDRRKLELYRIKTSGGSVECCEGFLIGAGGSRYCRPCDPVRKTVLAEMDDQNAMSEDRQNAEGTPDDEKEESDDLVSQQLGSELNGSQPTNGVDSSATSLSSHGNGTLGNTNVQQQSGEQTREPAPSFIKL